MTSMKHAFAVLLCGGGGTRLWPKSRNKTPKQFLRIGSSTDTLVQVAANRITKLVPWERVIVVTNAQYRAQIESLLPQVPAENILAEAEKRDTALAMLSGALFAYNQDPEAIIINGASDHVVADEQEFVRVMHAAVEVASAGDKLVAVGITPTRPDTAFGYIKVGDASGRTSQGTTVFHVENFTEKPNEATARAFISTGKYFWNANMYVWSAQSLINAFEAHSPDILKNAKPLVGVDTKAFHQKFDQVYATATSISIDYAISEKAKNLVLIPGDFGWNDVGDWKVVYDLGTKDLSGNVVLSDQDMTRVVAIHSHNNLVHTESRLIGLIGVDDLIVVDTGEILLIVPKSKSQDVKKIVEKLKEDGKKEYL